MTAKSGTRVRLSYKTFLVLAAGLGAALGYLAWGPLRPEPNAVGSTPGERRAGRPHAVERGTVPRGGVSRTRGTGEPRPLARAGATAFRKGTSRHHERGAAEPALERAKRAAADEPLSRESVGELIEEGLARLWPERAFSEDDYEQLTDAVLRVRAARRALREVPVVTATAEFIERQRHDLTDALAQFELVAGISPSELPDAVDPEVGLSQDHDEDDGEDVREPLSAYPPAD